MKVVGEMVEEDVCCVERINMFEEISVTLV